MSAGPPLQGRGDLGARARGRDRDSDSDSRATTTGGEVFTAGEHGGDQAGRRGEPAGALRFLLARADAAQVTVGHRPLSVYDQITGTRPFSTIPATDPKDSA